MDHLIFSLNATIPVFLTMVMGMLFRSWNLFDENTVSRLNKFVFNEDTVDMVLQDLMTRGIKVAGGTKVANQLNLK